MTAFRAKKAVAACALTLCIALTIPTVALALLTILNATKVLQPSDPNNLDQFGYSVSISADRALIGAVGNDFPFADAGSAYLFERNLGGADNWGQVTRLGASDAAVNDQFAVAVALDGNTAIIGAFADGGSDTGSAYVFERDFPTPGAWGEVKHIFVSGLSTSAYFGRSVAIDGDTIVVAAYRNQVGPLNNSGTVYVFGRNVGGANAWGLVKEFNSPAPAGNDQFGWTVSISGDTLLVSAFGFGAVYFFERNQGGADNWGMVQTRSGSSLFGRSAEVSLDTAVVGAYTAPHSTHAPPFNNLSGVAHVYGRDIGGADNWGLIKTIEASDGAHNDQFGIAADIAGNTIVVGAFAEDATGADSGSAYTFSRNEGGPDNWGEVNKLVGNPSTAQHWMGWSVAADQSRAIVGAPQNNLGPTGLAGFAHIFDLGGGGPTNPPGAATLTSPNGSIFTTLPTFTWNEEPDATWYLLGVLDVNSGSIVLQDWHSAAASCSGGSCSVAAPQALAEADYRWWVLTWNTLGTGVWSSPLDFAVLPAVPPGPVTLVSPQGIANRTPVFTWNEGLGATSYLLSVVDLIAPTIPIVQQSYSAAAASCSGGVCSVGSPLTFATGDYQWAVMPSNPTGNGPVSSPLDFAVLASPPGRPTTVAPQGTIGTSTPTFTWNEVPTATDYQFGVLDVGSGTVVFITAVTGTSSCAFGTCSEISPQALPPGNYLWSVLATNVDGSGPWAAVKFFTVQ